MCISDKHYEDCLNIQIINNMKTNFKMNTILISTIAELKSKQRRWEKSFKFIMH